jgi:alpha-galactosidase
MQPDIEIPREYGIYMPVGDTFSIGGAIRAARNVPSILSIAKDVEEVGHEKAWILNLANPMSILTRAITRETSVNTIGCCHELYGGLRWLARQLGFDYNEWREKTRLSVCGINHCGWMKELSLEGKDGLQMLRDKLAERGYTSERSRLYDSDLPDLTRSNVKLNLFLRYGVFPYSGDRHNAEFFTEFVNDNTDRGADYGVLLTSIQERKVAWRGKERARLVSKLAGKEEIDLEMSNEAAGRIIPALLLGRRLYDVGNLPCHGDELPGVPRGTVIERMVTYEENKAVPDPVKPLPQPVQEHLVLLSGIIEDYVEAAVSGNRTILLEALGRDPLLKNMDARKIPEMTDRLLEASREYVHPGFF